MKRDDSMVRLCVMLPRELIARLDEAARAEAATRAGRRVTRSEVIRMACATWCADREPPDGGQWEIIDAV